MPMQNWVRVRWLGLAPPSALEKKKGKVPLWRALDDKGGKALAGLSQRDRLDALADVLLGAYQSSFLNDAAVVLGKEKTIDADWAAHTADKMLDVVATGGHFGSRLSPSLCHIVLLAIARGYGRVMESRWDALLVPFANKETREIVARIPEPRRGRAIVAGLDYHFASGKADVGLQLLERFPSVPLVKIVLDNCTSSHRQSKRTILAKLDVIGKKHEIVKRAVDAYRGKQPKAIHLRKKRVIRAPTKLSAKQRAQLLAAGELYDGKDLSADERLHFFGGTLEIHEIDDAEGKPAYDVFKYMADDGTVFSAGTTDVVAWYVQSGLECDDVALYEALDDALGGVEATSSRGRRRRRSTS
jgi:hypothetical protein